ncbi:sulfatase [Neolewinella aurantiaca]|uniref:Sulfatase n=1 Tax=Neolewinella aurantiaca TaxID=2602767 RepID=A0A5C7FMC2_9BACT|nr:sulfatase [Neolewinella aurantiaca]TXF91238.1 sulfatase [Neolewinella aurantiaca]
MKIYRLAFAILFLAFLGCSNDKEHAASAPNVLFILADDLGYHDLGVTGSTFYETPHLDALARSGLQFTRAYTCSRVCSPARASIMTGQFTARHGITDWIGAKTGTGWRKSGHYDKLLPAEYIHALDTADVTMAEAFRDAGYNTFFAGKWHLGGEGSGPLEHGFEVNVGGNHKGSPAGGYFDPYTNPDLPNRQPGEQLSQRLARETADWIGKQEGEEPFFAMLSFYAVHGPLQTSEAQWARFRAKAVEGKPAANGFTMERRLPVRTEQDHPVYAGLLNDMDTAIGIVLDKLEAAGLLDNTIVVFTSDHGGVASGDAYATSNLPLRGGKGYQWEGGLRVPLLLRYPKMEMTGNKLEQAITGADIFPTLLSLAGLPQQPEAHVDGAPFNPSAGKELQETRKLYWHYPHYGNQGGDPSSVMMDGDYKLIHYWENDEDELYDLAKDPAEQTDISGDQPEITKVMRDELLAWLEGAGARYPDPDPDFSEEQFEAVAAFRRDTLLRRMEDRRAQMFEENWRPNADWWGSEQ